MAELVRRVGLGLAARGDVEDTIEWAREASTRGLDSIWFQDSYFERDAVTYATAVASHVEGIRVGLGSLNPYTPPAPARARAAAAARPDGHPVRPVGGRGAGEPGHRHGAIAVEGRAPPAGSSGTDRKSTR